jgi:hypothetical protein
MLELPPPAIELIAMQPWRNAIALVTPQAPSSPRQSPPSPPRSSAAVAVSRSKSPATETVPVNWQITWQRTPPRSTEAASPHRHYCAQGGFALRLRPSRSDVFPHLAAALGHRHSDPFFVNIKPNISGSPPRAVLCMRLGTANPAQPLLPACCETGSRDPTRTCGLAAIDVQGPQHAGPNFVLAFVAGNARASAQYCVG